MSQCPSCSQNIKIEESHYGTLFTCNHCQSVFFVGWDGVPETSSGSSAAEVAAPINPMTNEDLLVSSNPSAMDFITPSSENFIQPEPLPQVESMASDENFSEVIEFANAAEDKGLITYKLTIEGIDHSELHKQVADALTDSKFNWQVEEVLSRIKDGVLVLESLTPAMAVVLVNRLKYLSVEIQWRQNVLTN